MTKSTSERRPLWKRISGSWQLQLTAAIALSVGFGIWVKPTRQESIHSVDGRYHWDSSTAPPQRKVVWEPAQALTQATASLREKGDVLFPRLTDHGATLYFTLRTDTGRANLYRARFLDGRWQKPSPVTELNSSASDIGPAITPDGQTLYLSSNRPGGQGGYDLYVSKRTPRGWSKPKNLGPRINTPAHEHDPAIAPDVLALYFSSNRTPEMNRKAAEGKKPKWAETLRASTGLSHYDLYVTRRNAPTTLWNAPTALTTVNRKDSNEGAPFVSPTGEFLYFASNRAARPNEEANLDIYRARLSGDQITDVTNLGPTINTSANETEPALSPEGFTLLFASNRDGNEQIYSTRAREIFEVTQWEASRWHLVQAYWWKALLLTFVTFLLFFVVFWSHRWLFEKAVLARFIAASLLVHILVVLLMWLTPLPQALFSGSGEDEPAVAGSQIFDQPTDGANQPRPAYERMADLKTLAAVPDPQVLRQADPSLEVQPDAVRVDLTMPAPAIGSLPVREVPVERARIRMNLNKPLELDRQVRKPALKVIDLLEEDAKLPPPKANAKEDPLKGATVKTNPKKNVEPTDPALELPARRALPDLKSNVTVLPDPLKAEKPSIKDSATTPDPLQARIAKPNPLQPALEAPEHVLPLPVDTTKAEKQLDPAKKDVVLSKREMAGPTASERAASEREQKQLTKLPPLDGRRALLGRGLKREKPAFADLPLPEDNNRNVPQLRVAVVLEDAKTEKQDPAKESDLKGVTVTLPQHPGKLSDLPPSAPTQSLTLDNPLKRSGRIPLIPAPAQERDKPTLKAIPTLVTRRRADPRKVAEMDDQLEITRILTLRKVETRKEIIDDLGGTEESEEAVELGLKWLASVQNKDGSWSLHKHQGNVRSETAGTGLGVLPFLGAGYHHKKGKHQKTVDKALKWIVANQQSTGSLLAKGSSQHMYSHGIATIALCEAYALTKDPTLKAPAQRAVGFIVKAQNPSSGGWRYQPREHGDTSVLGWQVMALKSAQMAGLNVPAKTFEKAKFWLSNVEGNGPQGGTFGYTGRGASPAMTAQGLLCLQFMGIERNSSRLLAGVEYLWKHQPDQNKNTTYYWYNATQVMYHLQGERWTTWNERMRELHIKEQVKNGKHAGSWHPRDRWEKTAGRIFSTSLRLLMLEVYYRHLPLYQALRK